MPSLYIYLIVIGVVALTGLIATLLVGNSRQNRSGNPEYEKRTAGNWLRLGIFYIIATIISVTFLLKIIF
jgi:NADH:ubiquinone oxidoreductase subunit 3 (subunit A)